MTQTGFLSSELIEANACILFSFTDRSGDDLSNTYEGVSIMAEVEENPVFGLFDRHDPNSPLAVAAFDTRMTCASRKRHQFQMQIRCHTSGD